MARPDSAASLDFDGQISCDTLCAYLSRAATCNSAMNSPWMDDDLRLVGELGALFLGRSAYVWVPEPDDEAHFAKAAAYARRVHELNPRIICQAAVFEAVYPAMDRFPVPAWVFEDLGEQVERRCFRYADCFGPDFAAAYNWSKFGDGCQVPDITRAETRRWFYYRCRRYIEAGYEAIHLGQPHLYAGRDAGYRQFAELVGRVRADAAKHARRRLVLLDAHTHGIAVDGRLLFDLHSRPISARADREHPERIILQLKGRSLGGMSPSGWRCDSLPYLIEVDNWGGYSLPPEQWSDVDRRAAAGRWGWDDIAWLAHQPAAERDHFVAYAHWFCRLRDPMAFFQVPLRRLLGEAGVTRTDGASTRQVWHYHANRPSAACPDGFGQEDAIRSTWTQPAPAWLAAHHAASDVATLPDTGQTPPEWVSLVGEVQKPLGGVPGDSVCPHSRLRHRGRGVYELAAVLPWPGRFAFAVAVGGTMTEVYRSGGLCGGAPYMVQATTPNTRVLFRFDLAARTLSVVDAAGASVLAVG